MFLGGADSPGSEKTKNPWETDGASRRSSLSTKPEVMVTGSDGDQNAQNGAGVGKTPMPKLMSLLPVSYKRSNSRLLKKCHFLGCASPACTCSLIIYLMLLLIQTNIIIPSQAIK